MGFPTCTYAEWLKESVRACVDTIEFLQKFLREQGEPTNAPAPKKGSVGADTCPENRFELIFDENVDRPALIHMFE